MQFDKPVVLFDIDYTLFDTRKFKDSLLQDYNIYNEVMEVLTELAGLASLGIFSKGETEFQKTKLKKTGIQRLFREENTHIFDDKDINLIKIIDKYRDFKIILVDDKLEILHSAKKHKPQVFTVWVKRGPYAKMQKPILGFKPDAEIIDLKEVVGIISNEMLK